MTFFIHEHLLVQVIKFVSCHPARPRGNGALARGSFDGEEKDQHLGNNKPRAAVDKGKKSEDPKMNKKRGGGEGLLSNIAFMRHSPLLM